MKVKDFAKIMQKIAPENLKESYDNVGLIVGNEEKEVHTVLLALDCTLDVIEEAAKENLKYVKAHDKIKTKYCEDNGIKLIRIPYWSFNKIEEIIKSEVLGG